MSVSDLLKKMDEYYKDRIPYHDMYMSYTDNISMEKLLAPVIERIEDDIVGKEVLEIACGTGNWTQVLSKRASSVVATDLFEGYLIEAKKKKYEHDNVVFKIADAYILEGIHGNFNVAFASDWWSHMPNSRIKGFLATLQGKLLSGSKIIIIDMLRTKELDGMFLYFDEEGNDIQKRILPNGKEYRIIKNFPTEDELLANVKPYALHVDYHEDKELKRWILSYTIK